MVTILAAFHCGDPVKQALSAVMTADEPSISGQPISIQFTYSADDYVEGSRAAGIHFVPAKRGLSSAAAYVLTAVGIVGGPWVIFSNPEDHSAWLVGSAVFGLGLWYLYGLGVQVWRDKFGRRREFPRTELLQGIQAMRFSEAGLQVRGQGLSYEASWDRYKAFLETPHLFILSMPPGYTMIPKRAFVPDQLEQFQQMLSKKLPAAQSQSSGRGFLIALSVGIAILVLLYAALLVFAPKP